MIENLRNSKRKPAREEQEVLTVRKRPDKASNRSILPDKGSPMELAIFIASRA